MLGLTNILDEYPPPGPWDSSVMPAAGNQQESPLHSELRNRTSDPKISRHGPNHQATQTTSKTGRFIVLILTARRRHLVRTSEGRIAGLIKLHPFDKIKNTLQQFDHSQKKFTSFHLAYSSDGYMAFHWLSFSHSMLSLFVVNCCYIDYSSKW